MPQTESHTQTRETFNTLSFLRQSLKWYGNWHTRSTRTLIPPIIFHGWT